MAMPFNRRAPKYAVKSAIQEFVRWYFYSQVQVAAVAVQVLQYFTAPPGAGGLLAGNLQTPRTLSNPNIFDCFSVAWTPAMGTDIVDKRNVMNNTFVDFTIGSKRYLELPLLYLPSIAGFHGFATTTAAATTITESNSGLPTINSAWPLAIEDKPIHIPSQQVFSVTLNFASAAAVVTAFQSWFMMLGVYGREVQ